MVQAITIILPAAVFAAMWAATDACLRNGRALVLSGDDASQLHSFQLNDTTYCSDDDEQGDDILRLSNGRPVPDLRRMPDDDFQDLADMLMDRLIQIEASRYPTGFCLFRTFIRDLETIIISNAEYRPERDSFTMGRSLQARIAELLFLRRRALDKMFSDLNDHDELSRLAEANSSLRKAGDALAASVSILDAAASWTEESHADKSCTVEGKISTIPLTRNAMKLPTDSDYASRFGVMIALITSLERKNYGEIHADKVAADFLLEPLEGIGFCDSLRELHYLLLSLPDIIRLPTFKVSTEMIVSRTKQQS